MKTTTNLIKQIKATLDARAQLPFYAVKRKAALHAKASNLKDLFEIAMQQEHGDLH